MTNKNTLIRLSIIIAIIIAAFIAGRRSVDIDKDEATKDTKDREREVITIIEEPTGRKTKTIVRDRERVVKEVATSIRAAKSKYNVAAMASFSYDKLERPAYGVIITREFIGPVTLGIFGLANGTAGVTVGVNF